MWTKLDDGIFYNKKIQAAGKDAALLYVVALTYCARELTDGRLTKADVRVCVALVGVSPGKADKLVEVGLWEVVDGGYVVHDYHEYQPSAVEILAHRSEISKQRAEAGKKGMNSRWGGREESDNKITNRITNGITNGITNQPKTITNGITNPLQTDNPVSRIPYPDPETSNQERVVEWRESSVCVDGELPMQGKNTHTGSRSITNYSQLPEENLSRNGALSATEQENERENAPTPAPARIEITPELWRWARERGWTLSEEALDHATLKMIAYYRRDGKKFVDWNAQWELWVLDDIRKAREREAREFSKPYQIQAENMNVALDRWQVKEAIERCDLTDEEVEKALDYFKNYYGARGAERVDWSLEFANWLDREAEKAVYGWK